MNILFIILSIISLFLVLYSYVIYPLFLVILAKNKNLSYPQFDKNELPEITIIVAAHNEEKVIAQKLNSILNSDYPVSKLQILVGSDCSTDQTNTILASFSQIKWIDFKERTGKIGVINNLYDLAQHEIIIYTDANVIFEKKTIFELIKYFKSEEIGVVCGNILPFSNSQISGVGNQEKAYLKFDSKIKFNQSILGGKMIGAVGGCYAIRKNLVQKVPQNFIVDDFFISIGVLEKGKKALLNQEAHCYEDITSLSKEEFRRKVRISTGNFQNLKHYKVLAFTVFSTIGFHFFSYKVLRWLTPFLFLVHFGSVLYLSTSNVYFYTAAWVELSLILISFVEILLSKFKINSGFIRYLSHFLNMNLALFIGFFRFIFGVKSSIWKPTQRIQ